jgi:Na+/H+-dicarboxylate symporter
MTLLTESYIFDKIYVNFLIVGHTHSSIDQYFSVLSGAIKLTQFIGSPLTLFALLSKAHKIESKSRRPTVIRQIIVYFDVKTALEPYMNKSIKVCM